MSKVIDPGKHSDGGGLVLIVESTKGGVRKRWAYRGRIKGRIVELGLGSALPGTAHCVGLGEARVKAEKIRDRIAKGEDPRAPEASAIPPPSFKDYAATYVERHRERWRNDKHAAQWPATLEAYAHPVIGALPVTEVKTEHVLTILKPIWRTKAETARRLRGRIETVLDSAHAEGLIPDPWSNPARHRGHIALLLGKAPTLQRGHHRALPYDQMPALMAALRAADGMGPRALEFCILTAARTGEVVGATWSEMDLEAKLWNVPAERMKASKPHAVPLSARAVEILEQLSLGGTDGYIFKGQKRDRPISTGTMESVLERLKVPVTVHGFRSSFRDWCAEETGFPHEVAEAALAHTITNKVEAAYRRGTMMDKRRRLMDAWGAYCEPKGANVLPFSRSRRRRA